MTAVSQPDVFHPIVILLMRRDSFAAQQLPSRCLIGVVPLVFSSEGVGKISSKMFADPQDRQAFCQTFAGHEAQIAAFIESRKGGVEQMKQKLLCRPHGFLSDDSVSPVVDIPVLPEDVLVDVPAQVFLDNYAVFRNSMKRDGVSRDALGMVLDAMSCQAHSYNTYKALTEHYRIPQSA